MRFDSRQARRYCCKPHALLRALTNVIGNAVKHGGSARVALELGAEAGVAIDVDDDGLGIPDSEKAKVFELFYRVKNSAAVDQEGMGLGLAIARSVILGHGGSIELFDRKPRGLRGAHHPAECAARHLIPLSAFLVDAVNPHADELLEGQVLQALRPQALDVLRGDAMDAQRNQLFRGRMRITQMTQFAREFRRHAVNPETLLEFALIGNIDPAPRK